MNHRKLFFIEFGSMQAAISLPIGSLINPGCYILPLKFSWTLLLNASGVQILISFHVSMHNNSPRTYSRPWESKCYEPYQAVDTNANIFLVDFFSDGATLSKSYT